MGAEEDIKPLKPKKKDSLPQEEKAQPNKEERPVLKKPTQKPKPTTPEKVDTELTRAKKKLTQHTPTQQKPTETAEGTVSKKETARGSTKQEDTLKLKSTRDKIQDQKKSESV